ncbi:MAG: ferritin family protein [Planctomycetota bacterium]|jgi:rubrerythrin
MDGKDAEILAAIDTAMVAERKAKQFYLGAVEKASSERGKDLLRQLALFEEGHFEKLADLKASLEETGQYIRYDGTDFGMITSELPGELDEGREANLDDMLDVLRMAIDSETEACQRYRKMAKNTMNPQGKEMFLKLSQEETLHRRILSDEFYHLSNKGGLWSWGD